MNSCQCLATAEATGLSLRHFFVTSDHWVARAARRLRKARSLSLPAPRVVVRPLLLVFLVARSIYYWCFRIAIAEPLFKAYCHSYGKNLRTDVYIHWIQGRGHIIVGDDVLFDGKCSITFAARYVAHPTLRVGSRTGIGNGCSIAVAKSITIGEHCRIAGGVWMFDSSGHPADPVARLNNAPAADQDVRPIVISDNVWIGGRAVIFPGVTIGEGSVISACSVVTNDVPAYSVVAGNPARRIASLPAPPSRTAP